MKKFLKWFLGIAAVGAAVGFVIAYFCKNSEYDECDGNEDGEGESFEHDKDREYVPLKRSGENASEKEAAKPDKAVAEEKDKSEEEQKPEEEKPE